MNVRQAAEALSVSEVTVRRWLKSGKLKADLEQGNFFMEWNISQAAVDMARGTNRTAMVIHSPSVDLEQIQKGMGNIIRSVMEDANAPTLEAISTLREDMAAMQAKLDLLVERRRASWWTRFRRWLAGVPLK